MDETRHTIEELFEHIQKKLEELRLRISNERVFYTLRDQRVRIKELEKENNELKCRTDD